MDTIKYLKDALPHPSFEWGDYTYGSPKVHLHEGSKLKVGKFCSFAMDCQIFLGNNHRKDWVTTYPFTVSHDFPEAHHIKGHPATKGDVTIENDVWVGRNAMIMSGVTISNGAIIGAGAVVSSDVPPYAIVVGNPYKIIGVRFSLTQIEKLLKIKWWEWDIEIIKENLGLLCSPNIDDFIAKFS